MMVLSTIRYSKSGSSDIASKMRRHTPLQLQRLNRRNTLFHSPKASGRSRHGEPVRTIHSTPSTNMRLSRPVEPFWSGRPMISGAIRSHATSLKTKRSKTPKAKPPQRQPSITPMTVRESLESTGPSGSNQTVGALSWPLHQDVTTTRSVMGLETNLKQASAKHACRTWDGSQELQVPHRKLSKAPLWKLVG